MFKGITKKMTLPVLALMFLALALGCTNGQVEQEGDSSATQAPADKELILATTTSTYDSGLLDILKPEFEQETGYEVSIIPKGTGASLELGKLGDCDVILVHAKAREIKLVEEGYFVDRLDVMYNDFIILGPEEDSAKILGMQDAAAALEKIANAESEFASRGDNSGTHMKELGIWEKAEIKPEGDWYLALGQGMGDTLRVANEKGAYALADRGTYLSMKDKINLQIQVEGDPILFNQYGIMAVNPDKHEGINYDGAKAFIDFLVSEKGQKIIGDYKKFGEQLFVPNAQ